LEGPKAGLGPSNEHTVKTSSEIKVQYEKLGIDITSTFLRIIRESETGGDVVGNTTVSLAVVTDPRLIRKRFPLQEETDEINNHGKFKDDDDLRLLVTGVHLDEDTPDNGKQKSTAITVLPQPAIPHCPLRGRVWMLYEQRHIESRREYL